MLRIPFKTLNAYWRTRYEVQLNQEEVIALHIGEKSAGLRDLHERHSVEGSVFITAFNKLGESSGEDTNRKANEELLGWIVSQGLECWEGGGVGEDPSWPAEASFLVLGVDGAHARQLCVQFAQNAVVWTGADGVPALVLHPDVALV